MAVTREGMALRIAAGYKTSSDALMLGAVVVDDRAYPEAQVRVPLSTLPQHGVILGATGGGKTKTLQVIAEQLSTAGVPVVLADIKGDLQGLAQEGYYTEPLVDRAIDSGCDDWCTEAFPVEFAALGTEHNCVPIRAAVQSFGAILLAKALGLNETQESVLRLIFGEATAQGLPLDTLEDVREAVAEISRQEDGDALGYISRATASVIMREVRNLENDGGKTFFGSPSFDPMDLMRVTEDGRGYITLFELSDQAAKPVMFSIFLMWMLAKLSEVLPEAGVVDKPKLVIIFDEAHLLFTGASKAFLAQLIATVKLIRSKGVGVFFCSQTSKDIHPDVMDQMGLRVQHALRVRTPEARRALSHTVDTFPETHIYDLARTVKSLRKGEALVTVLTEDGDETPVARTMIVPPRSHMGVIGANAIRRNVRESELYAKYYRDPDPELDEEAASASTSERLAGLGGYSRFRMPEPDFSLLYELTTPEYRARNDEKDVAQ